MRVDSVFYYLLVVTCGSSISHLTLLAWERYIAIKHALRYKVIVTTKRLLTGTIMIWILEFALNAIFVYSFGNFCLRHYRIHSFTLLYFTDSLFLHGNLFGVKASSTSNINYRPTKRNKFFQKERLQSCENNSPCPGISVNMLRTRCHCYDKYIFSFPLNSSNSSL